METLESRQRTIYQLIIDRTDRCRQAIETLQNNLKYKFRDDLLLYEALTHSSLLRHSIPGGLIKDVEKYLNCNERLEFLGDAVLQLAISTILYDKTSRYPEGELTKIRASLVNETTLAEIARDIELEKSILLGRGEEICGGRDKDSILADSLEAVLGAIYLDGGFQSAYGVIELLFGKYRDADLEGRILKDYKSILQEKAQEYFKVTPVYETVEKLGPDHDAEYRLVVKIGTRMIGEGKGKSKKVAAQDAARDALENFDNDVLPYVLQDVEHKLEIDHE